MVFPAACWRVAVSLGACAAGASVPFSPARVAAFLQGHSSDVQPQEQVLAESVAFHKEIRRAMSSALICGEGVSAERLMATRLTLLPTWAALPKNAHGRVDWRTLRYVGHRHFMRKWSISIRGFEPSLPVNLSNWSTADIISREVPSFVGAILESHRAALNSFSLSDLVHMIVMLEQVVLDSQRTVLEHAYADQRLSTSTFLNRSSLEKVLASYLVRWLIADDEAVAHASLIDPTLFDSVLHWKEICAFAHGQIRSLEFSRQHAPRPGHGRGALDMRHSFDDAHEIVVGITTSFASFWQAECSAAKQSLVKMDTHATGRVRLSKFYGAARRAGEHFEFTDSEAYLRRLGALDESSMVRGKELIIPNYMQSATNCIISTPHYLVCCTDECESILHDIELAVGAASAPPAELLMIIGNFTMQASLDDDELLIVDEFLSVQLTEIASSHGGKVPLHGRLFAQWLHYALPRDCPFPHKTGSASAAVTPREFGGDCRASTEEMLKHIHDPLEGFVEDVYSSVSREALEWTSQWSPEEELFAGHGGGGGAEPVLTAPWEYAARLPAATGVVAAATCGVSLLAVAWLHGGARRWERETARAECAAHLI